MRALMIPGAMLLLAVTTLAQNDHKITTGVVAYQQGDYAKAERSLRAGLGDESKLKQKNIAKGWYHLGMTLIGIRSKAVQAKDMETLQRYDGALLESYECFTRAIEKNIEGRPYEKLARSQLTQLYNEFLSAGLQALNKRMYSEAIPYMDIAVAITENVLEEKNYLAYDLRAQAYLGKTDSVSARTDFIKAIETFTSYPPKKPDQLIGYVYYRLALLARYKDNNLDQALKYVGEGKEMVDKEHNRLSESDHSPEYWARLKEQYKNAKADLSAFELDILLNAPDKRKEALDKFERAIKDDPQSYIKHVAYAQLLETTDLDKAISIYEKAIAIDENKAMALFNLGALYVNRGAAAHKRANETDDYKEAEQYQEVMEQQFKKALPYMEKVYKLNPNDLQTIKALKQITISIGMIDDYNKYREAEQALKKR